VALPRGPRPLQNSSERIESCSDRKVRWAPTCVLPPRKAHEFSRADSRSPAKRARRESMEARQFRCSEPICQARSFFARERSSKQSPVWGHGPERAKRPSFGRVLVSEMTPKGGLGPDARILRAFLVGVGRGKAFMPASFDLFRRIDPLRASACSCPRGRDRTKIRRLFPACRARSMPAGHGRRI